MQKQLLISLAKRPLETLKNLSEDEIAAVIQYANYQYYNTDKPVFTDNVYDIIKEYLQDKNPYHPILKHVGAVVDDDERKVKLPYYMGSMDKLKSDSTAVKKWMTNYPGDVVVSDKLDGISGLFYWKDGNAKLFTRGNGEEGQTITHLLPFINNVPDVKSLKQFDEFTVRGELIMSKTDFQKVKEKGANARNMVAGLLNAKLPSLELARLTQFVAYELITPRHEPIQQMNVLNEYGFKVVPNKTLQTRTTTSEVLSTILGERREKSEFEVDGIIVTHNAIHNRKAGENPKYAFAFKSMAMMDRAEVIVKGVEWNVSKDGYMKPVVLFDPVSLTGAMVKRATGFNAKYIKDNKIGAGAKILVTRSGDVIPFIVEVLEKAQEADMPSNVRYTWNETGIDIVANLSNAKDEIELKNIEFFFSKVKVPGLSSGILAKAQACGLNTVGKIIRADKRALLQIEGFKDKMADKIYHALQERLKTVESVTLMEASNTFGRGIGEKKITLVAQKYPQLLTNPSFNPTVTDLTSIEGIEKKTATQFIHGIRLYWSFAKENGLLHFHNKQQEKQDTPESVEDIFKDVGFLFTGVRSKVTEDFIKARGGTIKSSVSKNVDVLICKDKTAKSSKIVAAEELGITIVNLEDFMKQYKIT
jgi:DNA ligase (NAD+)